MAKTNYILVDHENVQPTLPQTLKALDIHLIVFIGSNQGKISTDLAMAMQELGTKAEYVKIEGNGPNALDFHIAFHIGRISATDPNAYFHIISKDSGFDPLIAYLRAKKIPVNRCNRIEDIPFIAGLRNAAPPSCIATVIQKLSERKTPPPKTRMTLKNSIKTMFGGQLPDEKPEQIVANLEKQGIVEDKDGKLTYHLPPAARS